MRHTVFQSVIRPSCTTRSTGLGALNSKLPRARRCWNLQIDSPDNVGRGTRLMGLLRQSGLARDPDPAAPSNEALRPQAQIFTVASSPGPPSVECSEVANSCPEGSPMHLTAGCEGSTTRNTT